jgi:citrate lyase subunit beta/citryl-CoA lyase
MAARSYLRVPRLPAGAGADAYLVDAGGYDPAARHPAGEVWVGLNSDDEVRKVVHPNLFGVYVGPTLSATAIAGLGAMLAEAEEAVGLPVGRIAVAPVLGSAAGLLRVADIAQAPRVARLHLDEAALCEELGIEPSPDERELLWVRSQLVIASAAAGIAAPVAGSSPESGEVFRASTVALRRLGFGARECADPTQLPAIHEVFGVH